MNDRIRQMLGIAYELEGLLLLASERGEETPEAVTDAIRGKVDALNLLAAQLGNSGEDAREEAVSGNFEATEAECQPLEMDILQEEIDSDDSSDGGDGANGQEEKAEFAEIMDSEEEAATEGVEEDVKVLEVVEENPGSACGQEEVNVADDAYEVDAEDDDEPEPVGADGEDSGQITIDQVFIRNKSKNLRSAFSINDMFRFRRELFGNSAPDMTDAINLVEAMSDYAEAEDYFYNDLGWDRDSEEVAEFMEIIRNHFI